MPLRGVMSLACVALCLGACGGGDESGNTSSNLSLPSTASLSTSSVSVSAAAADPAPESTVLLSVSHLPAPPADHLAVSWAWSGNGIRSVGLEVVAVGEAELQIEFQPPDVRLAGHTLRDVVRVRVCYDDECAVHVSGSPLHLLVEYRILDATVPEPGIPPLAVLSRIDLNHDVLDAAYSRALDAIVMTSSNPRNALYVYDPSLGLEHAVSLARAPTALALDPGGLIAAVGHEGLISVVDLTAAGLPGAASPAVLDVTTSVQDLVLDGRGYVHALPRGAQFQALHSVEIATNTERLSESVGHSLTRAVVHPADPYLYLTHSTNFSPTDIEKFDVSTGVPVRLYNSPYHGHHPMCGNLWIKEDGGAIYTACGNTFSTSDAPGQDLLYAGHLQLSPSPYYGSRILWLSQSDFMQEILLIEGDHYLCETLENTAACYTRLNIYESPFLNRTGQFSISPITTGGVTYPQRGMFVFHSANGGQRYLISRLHGPFAPGLHYLSVFQ